MIEFTSFNSSAIRLSLIRETDAADMAVGLSPTDFGSLFGAPQQPSPLQSNEVKVPAEVLK